jgi:hypothetical protein
MSEKLSFSIHYGEASVSQGPFRVDLGDFKHLVRCIDTPCEISYESIIIEKRHLFIIFYIH